MKEISKTKLFSDLVDPSLNLSPQKKSMIPDREQHNQDEVKTLREAFE